MKFRVFKLDKHSNKVNRIFLFAFFILCSFCGANLYSQTDADFSFAHFVNEQPSPKHQISIAPFSKIRLSTLVLRTPYLTYKYLVSSNDLATCSFYPSCANFGMDAVSQYGFKGILLSIDRVSRCHNLDHHHYLYHFPSKKLYDPIFSP